MSLHIIKETSNFRLNHSGPLLVPAIQLAANTIFHGKKMKRSASTSSASPRTAWCPIIIKMSTSYEIHILWKDSRNVLKLFSAPKDKNLFGRVVSAEVLMEKNKKGEEHCYYAIVNEFGLKINFRCSLFSPALIGSNTFSKNLLEIRCETGGDQKIAQFLTRLPKSKVTLLSVKT